MRNFFLFILHIFHALISCIENMFDTWDLLEDAKFVWYSFIRRFVVHMSTHLITIKIQSSLLENTRHVKLFRRLDDDQVMYGILTRCFAQWPFLAHLDIHDPIFRSSLLPWISCFTYHHFTFPCSNLWAFYTLKYFDNPWRH